MNKTLPTHSSAATRLPATPFQTIRSTITATTSAKLCTATIGLALISASLFACGALLTAIAGQQVGIIVLGPAMLLAMFVGLPLALACGSLLLIVPIQLFRRWRQLSTLERISYLYALMVGFTIFMIAGQVMPTIQ